MTAPSEKRLSEAIPAVQQFQAFEGEEGKDFLDRFSLLCNDGRQTAGGDDSRGAAQFPFHASDNAIDQSHIAEQEAAFDAIVENYRAFAHEIGTNVWMRQGGYLFLDELSTATPTT